MMPILQGERNRPRERLYGECNQVHYIIENEQKYIWFARTGEEQLFDLRQDPTEQVDLSSDIARLDHFRQHLSRHMLTRDDVVYSASRWKPCANKPPVALWSNRA